MMISRKPATRSVCLSVYLSMYVCLYVCLSVCPYVCLSPECFCSVRNYRVHLDACALQIDCIVRAGWLWHRAWALSGDQKKSEQTRTVHTARWPHGWKLVRPDRRVRFKGAETCSESWEVVQTEGYRSMWVRYRVGCMSYSVYGPKEINL